MIPTTQPRLLVLLMAFCLSITNVQSQDIEKIDFKKPVQFSGSLNISLESYNAHGIEKRKKPFSWLVSGAPIVTVLGVQVPFSFLFSNFENRYYQPFNQFGISPRYKWATFHAGYRNIQFSQFTLAGYRMLGGGVELNPRKLRLGFMYGRLARSASLDSLQYANPLAFRTPPTYTRMAYAVKLGVGTERNYIDLSMLKGWDKEASLDQKFRDSTAPASNLALGVSWKITFLRRFSWQAEIGLSHYINDIYSDKLVADSSDAKIIRQLLKVFPARISSQLLTAGETRLSYQDKVMGLTLQYKRVDPEYRSMGAYFFQSDIEQFNFMPSFRLNKGKLFIGGSVGLQRDNLYRQKLATSERVTGNANINYNPSARFGVSFNYSNFGITQNPLRTSASDEIFKQVSQSFTLVPYLSFINDNSVKNIQFISSLQSLNSPMKTINTTADQHTLMGSLIYSHTWLKKQFSFNTSLNYNNTSLPDGDIGSKGGGVGFSIPVYKNRIALSTNGSWNSNTFNGMSNGYTINADVSTSVRILKRNSVQLGFNYLKNKATDQTVVQSFDEQTFRLGYGISF
ncbi:MAG: hypothetical protein EOO09_13200 [Chitinophagaceae bacterium]|nr:MAG: hypothetical protein EOO09_13200 [Chitinophagaceae bacterium]